MFGEIHNGNLWVKNLRGTLTFQTEGFDALNILRSQKLTIHLGRPSLLPVE